MLLMMLMMVMVTMRMTLAIRMTMTTTMMMIMVMVLMALNAGVVKGKTWVQVTVLHERHLLPLAPDQVLGAGLWVMLRHRQGKALGRWAQ